MYEITIWIHYSKGPPFRTSTIPTNLNLNPNPNLKLNPSTILHSAYLHSDLSK